MDNFKLWLYVIIGIVYLLSRLLKKRPDESKPVPQNRPSQTPQRAPQPTPNSAEKALTFEELLREITSQKETAPQPRPVAKPMPQREREKPAVLEDADYDYRKHDNVYDVYEEAKKQAFFRPSLEETMKVEDTVVKYGKFKEFELAKERDLMAEYLKDFQDPEGFKKAVVMSEILQRKF